MLRTLNRKLLLAGGGLLLGVAIAAAFLISNVLLIRTAVNHLTNQTVKQLELTGHFNTDIFRAIVEAESFVRTHDPADRAEALAKLRDAGTILDQLSDESRSRDALDQNLATAHTDVQQQRVAVFAVVAPNILRLLDAAERHDATAITRTLAGLTAIESSVETIEERSADLADQSMQAATAAITTVIQRAIVVTLGLFGLFALAVLGLLLFMRQTIMRPITQLSAIAQMVAVGNLDQALVVTSVDEVGSLQATFNHMIQQLHRARDTVLEYQGTLEARVVARTTELAVSNERFQLVACATNEVIWDKDFVQQSVWWNDNVQTLFGYYAETTERSIGWWRTQLHPDDQERVGTGFDAALAGGEQFWAQEYRFRRGDGSYADVLDRAYVLYDANQRPIRAIGSMMDITERKHLDRMQREFIATVSHELRTPVTSIRGSLGLLAGGVAGEMPLPAKAMIAIAYQNSERLTRLINDILDIEKLETDTLGFDLTPQELPPLVEQAIESNRAYGAQFGVTFVLEQRLPGSMVNVESGRLLQVLANMLSNAAKFSPPGETVDICISRRNHMIRIAISDHGPGIPTAFQKRIFQRFAQADSSDSRQKDGTGLGLSISKAIVEKLGGQIGFEASSNGGTTFSIDLPEWQIATVPQMMDA